MEICKVIIYTIFIKWILKILQERINHSYKYLNLSDLDKVKN